VNINPQVQREKNASKKVRSAGAGGNNGKEKLYWRAAFKTQAKEQGGGGKGIVITPTCLNAGKEEHGGKKTSDHL